MRALKGRGQATVELALGSIVLVTVILFGIHFAEVGYLSLKVQDAAAYAVWEATGRRVQDLKVYNNPVPLDRAITGNGNSVDAVAQRAYRDFNGLESVDTGSAVVVKGLTRGSALKVDCFHDNSLTFEPTPTASAIYSDRGGMRCNAEANLEAVKLATRFLDGANGFFQAKQYDARGAAKGGAFKVCGVGFANGSKCPGRLAVLLNDWGMSGDDQKGECNGVACSSKPIGSPPASSNFIYKDMVGKLFGGGGGWPDSMLFASTYAGSAPANPNDYYFSYAGLEDDYITSNGGEGRKQWNTGGAGLGSSNVPWPETQAECFLGRKGPGCP